MTFFTWYNSQSHCFKGKCVSMHNNAPSHVSKLTHEFNSLSIHEESSLSYQFIIFLMNSFHYLLSCLKARENEIATIKSWSESVKIKLYEGGRQYNSKADL